MLEDALDAPIDEKLTLIGQAQEIFAAEAPAVVLYYPDGRWGYRPGAYDGWISDPGHGVFTKRSFLAPYAAGSEAPEPAADEAAAEEVAEEVSEAVDAEPEQDQAEGEEPAAESADDSSGGTGDPDAPSAASTDDEAVAGDAGAGTPDPDQPTAAAETGPADDGEAGGTVAFVVVLVVAAAVAAFVVVRRRGREGTVED